MEQQESLPLEQQLATRFICRDSMEDSPVVLFYTAATNILCSCGRHYFFLTHDNHYIFFFYVHWPILNIIVFNQISSRELRHLDLCLPGGLSSQQNLLELNFAYITFIVPQSRTVSYSVASFSKKNSKHAFTLDISKRINHRLTQTSIWTGTILFSAYYIQFKNGWTPTLLIPYADLEAEYYPEVLCRTRQYCCSLYESNCSWLQPAGILRSCSIWTDTIHCSAVIRYFFQFKNFCNPTLFIPYADLEAQHYPEVQCGTKLYHCSYESSVWHQAVPLLL